MHYRYMLGLCEGNYCTGGKQGREPGNGRIIVSEYYEKDDKCGWDVIKVGACQQACGPGWHCMVFACAANSMTWQKS